jgi:hypothetical protein
MSMRTTTSFRNDTTSVVAVSNRLTAVLQVGVNMPKAVRSRVADTGCLSYQNIEADAAPDAHPDCSDSQLVVLEGDDGTFKATNYVRLTGMLRFLCWPIENRHYDNIDTDNVYSECSAFEFDQVIAQSSVVEAPPRYRSMGAATTQAPDEFWCPTKTTVKKDGTIIFQCDFRRIGGQKVSNADVFRFLRSELNTASLKHADSELNKATFKRALNGMEYDVEGGDDAVDHLTQFLGTISTCLQNNMSLVVGLFPERLKSSAFVMSFKNLTRNERGGVDVPCLSLVHEDANSSQPTDPNKQYEHLHEVRSSYWVAALLKPSTPFNEVSIAHSKCKRFINHHIPSYYDYGSATIVPRKLLRKVESIEAGIDRVPFPEPSSLDEMYEEDGDVAENREAAVTVLRRRFISTDASTMWPNNILPNTERVLRVTNLALALVGEAPVASITLDTKLVDPANPTLDWLGAPEKTVRYHIKTLQKEKAYALLDGSPPEIPNSSSWAPGFG